MINVIIVDDEPLALDVLETYIESLPDLNLVVKCANAIEANEALKANDIDLMFLDIEMPLLKGTDFFKNLVHKPDVIFADEPSGNLDTHSAENLHQLFFQLRDEFGQTFVIVTHNEELANMADRKLVMVDGQISN